MDDKTHQNPHRKSKLATAQAGPAREATVSNAFIYRTASGPGGLSYVFVGFGAACGLPPGATGPIIVLVGVIDLKPFDVWEADMLGPVVPVDALLPTAGKRPGRKATVVAGSSAVARLFSNCSLPLALR